MKMWRLVWQDPHEGKQIIWARRSWEVERECKFAYEEFGYVRGYNWPKYSVEEIDVPTDDAWALVNWLNTFATNR